MKRRADPAPAEVEAFAVIDRLGDRGLLPAVAMMCKRRHVTVEEVVGRSRTKAVVAARQVVWKWLHDERGLSWPEIAKLFDRKYFTVLGANGRRRDGVEDRVAERIAAWIESRHAVLWPEQRTAALVEAIRRGDWKR